LLTTEAVSDKEISNTWITVYRDHVHSFATIYQWVVHFRNSNSEITDKRRCVRRSQLQHRMRLTLFQKTFGFKRRNNKRNLVSKARASQQKLTNLTDSILHHGIPRQHTAVLTLMHPKLLQTGRLCHILYTARSCPIRFSHVWTFEGPSAMKYV
jgi:hypothetical protein